MQRKSNEWFPYNKNIVLKQFDPFHAIGLFLFLTRIFLMFSGGIQRDWWKVCKFITKEILAQMLYCEFDEIFENNFFTEHLQATASACTHCSLSHCVPFLCIEKFQLYANFCHVSYYKKPIYFSTRKLQKIWFFLMYVISQLFFQIQNFLPTCQIYHSDFILVFRYHINLFWISYV